MISWVLLRGLTRDTRHWGDFPRQLGEALPNARVIALDLPGNGARHHEKSPASIVDLVEDCRRSLSALGHDGPVNLLAMSLGAMVAVDWASRYPDEIESIVLINTSLRGASPFYCRLRPASYGRLLRIALSRSASVRERLVLALTSNRPPAGTFERWSEFQRRFPVSRKNALRQLLAAARFKAPSSRPPCDCLLLASARDGLVSVECSRSIADLWSVCLYEHPSAGHDLPLDDGRWVVDQLQSWITRRRPVRRA